MLAVRDGRILELPAGSPTWTTLFVPPPARPGATAAAEAEQVVALRDGRIPVGGTYLSWIITADGHVVETIDFGADEGVA